MLHRAEAESVIKKFPSLKMLVLGDVMLDEFVWGEVERISPEAPVPVVEVKRESLLLGGAANVAANIRALGGQVVLCGLVGVDRAGEQLTSLLSQKGIAGGLVATDARPTTVKTRIVARGQQVVRVDREERSGLGGRVLQDLVEAVGNSLDGCDGVVVSDYAKGVVCGEVMAELARLTSSRGIPLLVDPKPVNVSLYKGATILTPNKKEAEAMSGIRAHGPAALERIGERIAREVSSPMVLVTMGSRGMALFQTDAGVRTIDTMAKEVFDVTGAGDTVIAALGLSFCAGLSMFQAAQFANAAAGVVVGKVGTGTVEGHEVLARLGSRE